MQAYRRGKLYRWGVIALCLVVAAVCGYTTQSLAVTKRGIVIGLGLDRQAEEYVVSVQMMQAGAGNSPDSPAMYEVVVGRGATVREAMADVTKKTSLYPSYAHCKVLVVGEDMLSHSSLDDVMISFMHSNELGNVQVLAASGMAYDMITATVAISPTTSAYIERDNQLVSKFGGRRLVSLKDYCQRVDGKSGNKFLPYAVAVPAEKPTGGDAVEDKRSPVLYDLLHTAAFDEHGKVHVYGEQITLAVGLVETKGGQFTAYDEAGRYVTVKIDEARRTRTYAPHTVEGHYVYEVSVVEQTLAEGDPPSAEVESLVARRMDEAMAEAFDTCRADGVDIFSVGGHLYKRYGEVTPVEECRWLRNIEVKCK